MFEKHVLKNGLRIITIPMKTETALAMVLVGAGSEFESEKHSGLAHFLEHMCFKGTHKRPTSRQIAYEFDALGADINAFTGKTYTGYYAKAHKKHLPVILEMVSDLYLNPTLPVSEIEKEKGVIIQEINMYEDDPQSKVRQILIEAMFSGQAAGRDIAGTKETVSSFTHQDLQEFRSSFYVPNNTVVVVAGNFSKKHALQDIENYFGVMRKKRHESKQQTRCVADGPRIVSCTRPTDQTHLMLSFYAPDMFSTHVPTLQALTTALGGGMSSRLFTKMREELGICYYVGSTYASSLDYGVVHIYAGVESARLKEALEGIINEIRRIKASIIDEIEMRKVKDYRLSGLVLDLETPQDYADFFGFQELLKRKIKTIAEHERSIELVTPAKIKKIANTVFTTSSATLAIVGPDFNKEEITSLLAF